jgi:hypothetical protein
MILVILGAGASYDSVAELPPGSGGVLPERPPLADELFDSRPAFRDAVRRLPLCHEIVPLLRDRGGRSLEDVLAELALEATTYPKRHQQLMALRYYIQAVLRQIEDPWLMERATHVTNHKVLFDQIRRWVGPDLSIATVTFNYDTLVEHSLEANGCAFQSMEQYVANDRYTLFKLHGSASWYRKVAHRVSGPSDTFNQWQWADFNMRHADEIELLDEYGLSPTYPSGFEADGPVVPAIAIPVASKAAFECPSQHVERLRELLPQVSRVVIVGWKAGERHFLDLMARGLPPDTPALVVCGNVNAGQATVAQLQRHGVPLAFTVVNEGFSGMVVRRTLDRFF